jgi:hypothetical protein
MDASKGQLENAAMSTNTGDLGGGENVDEIGLEAKQKIFLGDAYRLLQKSSHVLGLLL